MIAIRGYARAMQTIALIDYGSGNLHSAERALRRAASEARKTREIRITSNPETIARADRIVLPGVGHFADCRRGLADRAGLEEALAESVLQKSRPFFGICVGMQLMADRGLEDGDTAGLGWIPGTVRKLAPPDGFRIPHMGWNALTALGHPLFKGVEPDEHAYFVHSYAFETSDVFVAARSHHGVDFTAAVARGNMFGTQFHPEKSQSTGLKILSNFMSWSP